MPGNLSFETLKTEVTEGKIDTVIAAQIDMQGRLMGKRFHARHFIDDAWQETHGCNYLLATDMEMFTVEGYSATSWAKGYGDYIMKPDLTTLRRVPWLEGTALVLCDTLDHHHHEPVPHAPRNVLRHQLQRLENLGYRCMAATELEFFLFQESYETLAASGYHAITPISPYNEDYHIFQTTKEERVMRAIRNGLFGAGIPVENSKGEADPGQEEINIRYSDALDTADNHSITKNACKEIAWAQGHGLTFMAKWHHDAAGSSSHIHQSLVSLDGTPVFHDPSAPMGMSRLMRHYLAGLLAHAADCTFFLAPYVNSYKRYIEATFAPTKMVWSMDNRTAGFRVCGEGTKAIRVENRIGGADLNPYLALASQIAAGIAGIEQQLEPADAFNGDAYSAADIPTIPNTLRAATKTLDESAMLRQAMGDAVIDHYVHAARWEQEDFDRKVTDYEIRRGFERG